MRASDQDPENTQENDPVWELLARDAKTHPVLPSPWFATRTAALARSSAADHRSSWQRSWIRFLLPVPLVGVAALILLASRIVPISGTQSSSAFVSSEEGFEQNMEMLFASQD